MLRDLFLDSVSLFLKRLNAVPFDNVLWPCIVGSGATLLRFLEEALYKRAVRIKILETYLHIGIHLQATREVECTACDWRRRHSKPMDSQVALPVGKRNNCFQTHYTNVYEPYHSIHICLQN